MHLTISMKRYIIALLTLLLIPCISFSQNTSTPTIGKDSLIVITPFQLRQTNLILAEHAKLKEVNVLLNDQINNLQKINSEFVKKDSLRLKEIGIYNEKIQSDQITINNLNESLKQSMKKIRIRNYMIIGISAIALTSFLFNVF